MTAMICMYSMSRVVWTFYVASYSLLYEYLWYVAAAPLFSLPFPSISIRFHLYVATRFDSTSLSREFMFPRTGHMYLPGDYECFWYQRITSLFEVTVFGGSSSGRNFSFRLVLCARQVRVRARYRSNAILLQGSHIYGCRALEKKIRPSTCLGEGNHVPN